LADPLSLLITIVVSIFLAIIIYQLSKKEKDLVYDCIKIPIASAKIKINEKLKIYYGGSEINSLAITKISLCNRGLDTIHFKDISEADQIRVKLDGTDVSLLDAELIYENRKINNFSLQVIKEENITVVNFDFLDKNDGAVIQLLHTDSHDIETILNGTVIGNKRKEIQKYNESDFVYNLSISIQRILPEKDYLAIPLMVLSIFIFMPIFTIGYFVERIFKFNKRLPREFVLNKK